MSNIPTFGGQATRGETFAKLIHHLREAQDMAALMGHLHNTEGNDMDKLLAKGWLGVSELIKGMTVKVTSLAMKRMQ